MQNLQNYHILYINLDSRSDRRRHMENQLEKLNLLNRIDKQTHRISGVIGNKLKDEEYLTKIAKEFNINIEKMCCDYWFSRKNFKTMSRNKERIMGQVGCYLGHLRAINYAIQHKLSPVVILEDDCTFLNKKQISFPKVPSDAEIFYLGGLFWHQTRTPRPIPKNSHWLKIDTEYLKLPCAFAYGFNNIITLENTATLLTSVWMDGKGRDKPDDWRSGEERIRATALDFMFLNFIQRTGNAYIISDVKAVQSDYFMSDVTDVGKKTPKKPYKHSYFYS